MNKDSRHIDNRAKEAKIQLKETLSSIESKKEDELIHSSERAHLDRIYGEISSLCHKIDQIKGDDDTPPNFKLRNSLFKPGFKFRKTIKEYPRERDAWEDELYTIVKNNIIEGESRDQICTQSSKEIMKMILDEDDATVLKSVDK